MQAITQFAFAALGAQRVEAFPDEQNLASRGVCERAGFALEGVLRNERVDVAGKLRNTCVYGRYDP